MQAWQAIPINIKAKHLQKYYFFTNFDINTLLNKTKSIYGQS